MERDHIIYQTYLEILRRELVCAMGCTEPIAVAYCAAVARRALGQLPDRIMVEASGNVIKNVKSVIVPTPKRGCRSSPASPKRTGRGWGRIWRIRPLRFAPSFQTICWTSW